MCHQKGTHVRARLPCLRPQANVLGQLCRRYGRRGLPTQCCTRAGFYRLFIRSHAAIRDPARHRK